MSDLGWGAGGLSEALQLIQSLQTGKIENQQRQVALEGSQLQLENQKKLQASLAGGNFAGLTSSDPDAQTKSMHDLANTYLANGMPEQAKQISDVANSTARTKADVTAQQATTALNYIDTAQKVFAGVTTPEEWNAAQQLMQAELPPEALQNPAIKGLLTSGFDPAKIKILPEFLDRMKSRAQIALDGANKLRSDAETRTQGVDVSVKEEQIRLDKAREAYLRAQGGWDPGTEGSPDGDKLSQLRYLVTQGAVPLPLGTRSAAARNQFFQDALKNNPGKSAQEIFDDIKSGYIGMKGTITEAGAVAKREANISTASLALTEPGGLYDQLDAAASKVDFGDSKTVSQVRKGLQSHVYANEDIQAYVTTLEDARAELGTVLSRSGQLTDVAREQAKHALPDTASLGEIKAAIAASRKAADAVMHGNTTVMNALKSGKTVEQALAAQQSGGSKVFASEAAAAAAAKAGKIKKGDKITIGNQDGTWQ
jgi:hypothetical protein